MTHDDTPMRDDDARRVVEALADLFDAAPPGDRPAAEEELREAGIDATGVARRIAARVAAHPHVPADLRLRPAQLARGAARRPSADPAARPRRRSIRYAAMLVAAGVVLGVALARTWWTSSLRQPGAGDETASTQPRRPPHVPPRRAEPPAAGAAEEPVAAAGRERRRPPARTPAARPRRATPSRPQARCSAKTPMPRTRRRAPEAPPPRCRNTARAGSSTAPTGRTLEGLLPPVVLDRVKRGDYWFKVLQVDPDSSSRTTRRSSGRRARTTRASTMSTRRPAA